MIEIWSIWFGQWLGAGFVNFHFPYFLESNFLSPKCLGSSFLFPVFRLKLVSVGGFYEKTYVHVVEYGGIL